MRPEEGGPAVPLEVVAVDRRGTGALVQFSVLLQGPVEPVYPQRSYRLGHPRLGEREVFISPVARTAAGTRYEACFSHDP
jgi:hypothetical protein